jgi:hypothetical protein
MQGQGCMVDEQDITSNDSRSCTVTWAAEDQVLLFKRLAFSDSKEARVFHPDGFLHMLQQCAVVVGNHRFKFLTC